MNNIKSRRKALKLSQVTLAEYAGTTQQLVSRAESREDMTTVSAKLLDRVLRDLERENAAPKDGAS